MAHIGDYPEILAREDSLVWFLAGQEIQGNVNLLGIPTASTSLAAGGYWEATLEGISIRNQEQRDAWMLLSSQLEGVKNSITLRKCPKQRGFTYDFSYDSELYYSLALSYTQWYSPGGDTSVTTVGSALLRATSLTITGTEGSGIGLGKLFSINHGGSLGWRMYVIQSVSGDENPVITFRPPLRAAVSNGTGVELGEPRCRMKLATSREMRASLKQRKYGSPTINFVEAFGS